MALLPFILHGFYMTAAGAAPVKTARWLSVWTMSVLSLVSHKEFRFIQPLLPILHAFAAYSLVQLANLSRSKTRRSSLLPSIRADHFHLILFINIPAILVFIVIHMRGQAGVVRYLSSIPKTELASLGFLMPCHSTPWQSHLHRYDLEVEGIPSGYGGRLWALTCEPPLGDDRASYIDETNLFYKDPHAFIREHFPSHVSESFPASPDLSDPEQAHVYCWPSHLVLFDVLLQCQCETTHQTFNQLLLEKGYVEQKRFWNSIWHEDPRRAGDVVVMRHINAA
ncbi:MAG: glycosylphosphatidylinositol anchor biosynthesis [Cyphobasidiales sp. Tagirdzhanova-0007]|nr:MAG: glycosylphosphatidylinositol anchor biosynthesis [Cyphobasidiales sp. Tagirdzhanova-0007]